MVELAGEIDRGAVGEMPAVSERHAEDGVPRLQRRHVDSLVGLRSGVRLHVGIGGAEQLLGALDREILGDIHLGAAAVITLARIAFGILVGELRTLRFEHRAADVVFGGDQLDVVFLALVLRLDRAPEFGIDVGELVVERGHGAGLAKLGMRDFSMCDQSFRGANVVCCRNAVTNCLGVRVCPRSRFPTHAWSSHCALCAPTAFSVRIKGASVQKTRLLKKAWTRPGFNTRSPIARGCAFHPCAIGDPRGRDAVRASSVTAARCVVLG